MNTYKCIRKCHYLGRVWKVGEILEALEANHHFELTASKEIPAVTIKPVLDPMKPVVQEPISALSEFAQPKATGGFATSLQAEVPGEAPKRGRPRKQ